MRIFKERKDFGTLINNRYLRPKFCREGVVCLEVSLFFRLVAVDYRTEDKSGVLNIAFVVTTHIYI